MHISHPLKDIFGGRPGWLANVPAGTHIDFSLGTAYGPLGKLVRSPASKLWAAVPQQAMP